jgi:hypothetical protein
MLMTNALLALAALLAATSVRAQSVESLAFGARAFEAAAFEGVQRLSPEDAFAGVDECSVLDIKTIRPIAADEAADMIKPCLDAVARKYSAKIEPSAGFLSMPQGESAAATGLLLKTDFVPGSKAHLDLLAGLSRRDNRLLGQPTRVLTRGETAPAAVSAVQKALEQCMVLTVVRDIKSGEDFVRLYGRCLTRNPDLKIKEVRAGEGLVVNLRTDGDRAMVEAYNGFVTVNAGKGPVQVMIVAYGALIALP